MELVVLSRLYGRSIVVYHELESHKIQEQVFSAGRDEEKACAIDKLTNPVRFLSSQYLNGMTHIIMCLLCCVQILLAYLDGNHYDGVYTVQHMETLTFCQGNT